MSSWRDLRYAARSLARTPAFSIITILTLALGIGANTAIFSVVSAVLLKPLPYPKPDQLLYISTQFPQLGLFQFAVSPPEVFELRERAQSFSGVGAYTSAQINLSAPDRPRRVAFSRVSDGLLQTLGTHVEFGRWFETVETLPNGPDVVILTHELWRSVFGANSNIIGQVIEAGGVRRTVIGVMPPGFDIADQHVELLLPLVVDPANRLGRAGHYLYVIARLRDGATINSARAELATLVAAWPSTIARPANATNGPHTPNPVNHPLRYDDLHEQIVGSARTAVVVLQGAVVVILLIACANIANLLLARAESRHKELAVRAALGAGARQLLAPFIAEALILSLAGGAFGLAIGAAGLRIAVAAFPDALPRSAAIALDARVMAFTFAVAIACAVVFSLTPLLHMRVGAGAEALKEGGQRTTAGVGRNRVRRALVAGEVALALALVVGAGLLLRTVFNLSRVDSGFIREHLVTFGYSLPGPRYPEPGQMLAFHRRILEAMRAVPGITAVASMSGLPPARPLNANDTDIEGYTAIPGGPAENVDYYQTVSPDYIQTMGIPVVEGRAFLPTDAGDTTVLINQTMARRFFPGGGAVGHRLRCCGPDAVVPWFTIIGVVKDVKQGGVDKATGTELYFDVEQLAKGLQNSMPQIMNVVMRTTLTANVLAPTVQRTLASFDPSLPVIRLRTMDDVFADAMGRPRLLANLLGVFAAVALLLAAIGTFGVLSYMVGERRREIGIRMALGAGRALVLRMVLSQGMLVAGAGIVLGLAIALGASRVIESLLFGVSPFDVTTLAAVTGLIALISLIGCYLPARSATRVDPMIVLRDE